MASEHWLALQRGIYLIPSPGLALAEEGWQHQPAIPPQPDLATCRAAIDTYAVQHNLISAYVTPRLHHRSVRRWERRNGCAAPPLA